MMRRWKAALVGLAVLVGGVVGAPGARAAGAAVTITPARAAASGATTLTLRGTGFQSVPNGFGGVYVLFGSVSGAWRPSQHGQSGIDYLYVPDDQEASNHGYQKFVAFPGDPTAAAANGGTLAADGGWSTTLVVPGPVVPVNGRDGAATQLDCRVKQCGVITIGAHGVVNANNETFTPVSFAAAAPSTVRASTARPSTPAPTSRSSAAPVTRAASTPRSGSAATSSAPIASSSAAGPPAATSSSPAPIASDSFYSPPPSSGSSLPTLTSQPTAAAHRSSSAAGWLIAAAAAVVVAALAVGGWWLRHRTGRNQP